MLANPDSLREFTVGLSALYQVRLLAFFRNCTPAVSAVLIGQIGLAEGRLRGFNRGAESDAIAAQQFIIKWPGFFGG